MADSSGWEELDKLKERAQRLEVEVRDSFEPSSRGRRRKRGRARHRPGADRDRDREPQRKTRARARGKNRWLTPEEQAYHEASRRAERKIKFVQHLISYACVVAFLMILVRPVGVLVALCWGIGLASHFFQAMVAPDLRRRWISSEVDRQVQKTVTRQRRTLEGEQLRSLEELSASIAHEIRNPITATKSLVQQIGDDPSAEENIEYAKVALEELDRVERSISHLLRYAREEEMQMRSMSMSEVVDGALDTLADRIEKSKAEVRREVDSDGDMEGDPEKLRRVVINLVGNALDALDEAEVPQPLIEVGVGENLAGSEVWLRVKDNGPGVDEETQSKMFRPFFTSKANGTGLGLAISRKLVDAHGGAIELHSAPGAGTEFVITFPKVSDVAAPRG
jgi:signal transduction histidine kinase